MGGSSYSHDYAADVSKTRATKSTNDIFTHQNTYQRTGQIDKDVDPKGVKVRESRDSDAHPNSNAIVVSFDVTGSMQGLPILFAKEKLPKLMSILLAKNVIEDPQILFVAQADSHGDPNSLQIGQFESGNEMDLWLTKFSLGGGGGAQGSLYGHETYGDVLYWVATHTSIDCFEKRGRKGTLVLIGDEEPYSTIEREAVKRVIGDDLQEDLPLERVIEMAQEKYNVIKICVETPGYNRGSLPQWQKLLGEHAIYLDDPNIVCEFIAAQIAAFEGHDQDSISAALSGSGLSKHDLDKVTKALVPSTTGNPGIVKKGSVTGDIAKVDGAGGGNTRL